MNAKRIATVIAQTVAETPDGAPSGVLYAGLMGIIDLATYQSIVDALKRAGLIDERAHCLYPTTKLLAAAAS